MSESNHSVLAMDSVTTSAIPGSSGRESIIEKAWFNAIWFQMTWCCAVLGRETLLPLTATMLVLHLTLVRDTTRELLHLTTLAAIGIVIDAGLSLAGVFRFPGGVLVPLWLCGLWLAFATTPGRSLSFLGRRPTLAVLAGAVAIPLNYWAGQRLGAVEFGYPVPVTLAVMSLVWAVMLPVLFRLTALIGSASGSEELT